MLHQIETINNRLLEELDEQTLAAIVEQLDALHTAASEGRLSKRETAGYLREIIYTAQETLAEIERNHQPPSVVLRIVEQPKDAEMRIYQ
ncbi:MAG: hypothetical protein ACOCZH_00660 [Phototrophicaceae bacterium]